MKSAAEAIEDKVLLGTRCTPNEVFYSVIRSTEQLELLQLDKIALPKFLSESERLRYARSVMLDILTQNKVDSSVIKIIEHNAQKANVHRVRLEGVIIEAIASSKASSYETFVISQIASRLDIPANQITKIASGEIEFDRVPEFATYNKFERESILAALSANYI